MKRKELRAGLSRDEAELLVDLLMLCDYHPADRLEDDLRDSFGMVSRERELDARGKTLEEIRIEFAMNLLEGKK